MEAVHRHVPTHRDHECVAVDPGSPWLVMEEIVKVCPYHTVIVVISCRITKSSLLRTDINECNVNNGGCEDILAVRTAQVVCTQLGGYNPGGTIFSI